MELRGQVGGRLLLVLTMASTGCAELAYTPTGASRPPGQAKPFRSILMTYRKPMKSHDVVGRLETKSVNDTASSLLMLRNKASELGVDGICEIRCAGIDTVGEGNCAGNAFVWASP